MCISFKDIPHACSYLNGQDNANVINFATFWYYKHLLFEIVSIISERKSHMFIASTHYSRIFCPLLMDKMHQDEQEIKDQFDLLSQYFAIILSFAKNDWHWQTYSFKVHTCKVPTIDCPTRFWYFRQHKVWHAIPFSTQKKIANWRFAGCERVVHDSFADKGN